MRLLVALMAAAAAPLSAQPASPQAVPAPNASAQGDVAVTIYNNDLALVQDRRDLNLPAGRSRQEFPDVSARIRAETVTLTGTDIGIVEQNFDYDLLSPAALMQKAVGETITLVRVNPATGAETRERARVLAANGGVVLQIGERIEVLRDDGLPARVIFDKVPEGLRPRPTLSVTLTAPHAGRQPVTLTYLTPGLAWDADYVALFDEAAGRMDVQGWITLNNQSGTAYPNADVVLVAGAVGNSEQRYDGRYPPPPPPPPPRADGVMVPGTESANRARVGDFYLYPLPQRTTIAQAQQKQVSFLDVSGTPAARAYEYRNPWLGTTEQPVSASSVLRFSTGARQGLGDALPAGTVRVYQRDTRGTPQFVGESRIGHTPMGSDLGLTTGQAFDIKVQPTVVERTRLSSDGTRWRTAMRYRLTNASPRAVTVELLQDGLWGDTRIVSESQKSTRSNANTAAWRVAVPANGEATVTATFDTRF
jgi:hypothetical protein